MWYTISGIVMLLLFQFIRVPSYAASPEDIVSAVEARYRITKPAFLGGFKEIGSVLSVRREGLRSNRPSKIFSPNVIRDNRIETVGGGDIPPGGDIDPDLKIATPLHLYGINTGENYVQLELFTVNTFVVTGSGTRGPSPLQASTRFIYDRGVDAVTVGEVLKDIGEWFSTDGETSKGASGVNRPGMQGITRTVHLGQTGEEVVSILGPPSKIFLLGAKSVFVYPDIKVVLIDGKVTDAE